MLFFKRLILFIVAVAVIVFAIAISGLNTEKVLLNLYWFKFELSLGFLLILSLFVGLLTGLLMALFNFYMPLKSQIRKLARQNRQITQQILTNKRLEQTDD
ncbi:MAG: LapA family protein [Alcanivoracaceae bacterium]|nr:LapA family protein [Alcanivoracaceae bacterium]